MFVGDVFPENFLLICIQLVAIILGFWAVFTMRIGNFNITPIPVKNAVLVENGSYRLIRHPMYLSIFLFVIPEIIGGFSMLRFIAFLMLLITILFKIKYEEMLLQIKLKGYADYMNRSFKLIPFLY